jgi:hypothetical protein
MKFTIRDLFLVTACVALAVGWRVDRSRLEKEIKELRAEIVFGFRSNGTPISLIGPPMPKSQAPAPIPPKNQSGPDNDP